MILITSLIQAEFIHQNIRRALAPQTELQCQPHPSECRRLATALYSIGIAGFMTAIYRHAHHDDPRRYSRDHFLKINLGVCSSSNLLGQ